jgi:nitroimidazol reductase NimA-like FMN-containing flavoprotein (pyridoxamine 5'-phosphate oxidase superfamily)
MNLSHDAHGFVILDRAACLQRLALHRVASLAITEHALPMVLPALYMVQGNDILVGASRQGTLGRCLPNSVVSLCVHDVDDDLLSGWTVTVTGWAQPVDEAAEFRRWATDDLTQIVVRISTDHVSGRQIVADPTFARPA